MKKDCFLWGGIIGILALSLPLLGGITVTRDRDTGQEYTIVTPDIVYPTITIPEIQKMSIQELKLIRPIQLVYALQRATIEEISTISPEKLAMMVMRPSSIELQLLQPEKLAIVICQLERKNLDEVLQKITPRGYWVAEQKIFYDVWIKKDVKQMAKMIQQGQRKEMRFFTAYSTYQNFDEVNWGMAVSGFDCRQVLVNRITHNNVEKFKPEREFILTIDFNLSSYEIKTLLEMIEKNRDKIKMVIMPWGGAEVNNYDNRNVSTYKTVADYFDRLAFSIREITPEIPIYLTVCLTSETIDAWVRAFQFKYDGIALWNILTTKGNLKKAYNMVAKYNKNVILSGVMQCNPVKGWVDFNIAVEKTLQDINKIKEAGFSGVILMTNEKE